MYTVNCILRQQYSSNSSYLIVFSPVHLQQIFTIQFSLAPEDPQGAEVVMNAPHYSRR